jgi:acetylornithine deacetylase
MNTSVAFDDVISILATLVGFDTTSSESNLPLIGWVEDYLAARSVPYLRVNASDTKSSLLACVGPKKPGGIVLSGHTDVVPTKDQIWSAHPYFLSELNGLFYGRGTSDMKSFLALALAYIPYWQSLPLSQPIWLAFSHDEEIGCLGATPMAQAILAQGASPSLVVIGEPTEMQLVSAHKGIHSFETVVTGKEAHSSMPHQGANAVMELGALMHELNQIRDAAKRQPPSGAERFTPAFSTVHIGVIEGGVARNIIPRQARMLWEVRPVPGENLEALLAPFYAREAAINAQMKAHDPQCGVLTRSRSVVPGLASTAENTPYLSLAMRLAGTNQNHFVAFGTEGGFFQQHGLPVVICGPGSIDQAHQPDEFIAKEQLHLGMEFMQRVGAWASGA